MTRCLHPFSLSLFFFFSSPGIITTPHGLGTRLARRTRGVVSGGRSDTLKTVAGIPPLSSWFSFYLAWSWPTRRRARRQNRESSLENGRLPDGKQ